MSLLARSIRAIRNDGFDRALLLAIRYASYRIGYHDGVSRLPRPLAERLFSATFTWVRVNLRLSHRFWPMKYTDADPFKTISVDPSIIKYTSGASRRRGWVIDGEWDKSGKEFMQRTIPLAIEQRFAHGSHWNETGLASKYDRIEFQKRTRSIESLYKSISEEGYKSQCELIQQSPEVAWDNLNDAMHPLVNEIAVDIGRDGEILWNMCGQHRLAIAKVLGVDQVPVQVFCRHTEWQKIREGICAGEKIPSKLHDHPDLRELVTDT